MSDESDIAGILERANIKYGYSGGNEIVTDSARFVFSGAGNLVNVIGEPWEDEDDD